MKIWVPLSLGIFMSVALAQEATNTPENTVTPEPTPLVVRGQQVPDFLRRSHTKIKDPLSMRDPFKRPNDLLMQDERQRILSKDKDTYSNYETELPIDIEINTIKLIGILLGPQRRAIVRIGNNAQNFVVREGMSLGPERAEVKAILPGGMVLVEKIKNVYNQDEYVETIIPLSREEELLEKKE